MTTFKTLEIQGFGSIVNKLTYNLDSPGINIIQAINGDGKTTIFSALTWVCWGKTLKNKAQVQSWEDVRPKHFKGTKVKILFEKDKVNYKIIRYEKFKKVGSSLLLFVNGKLRNDLKGKEDTKQEIIKILGSFDLFKNSVVFGQKMKRIIEEDGPTKKKVFDEIFETEYLQNAKKAAENKRDNLEKESDKTKITLDLQYESLINLEQEYETLKKTVEEFEINKTRRITFELQNLKELRKEVEEINQLNPIQGDLGKLKGKLNDLYDLKDQVKDNESLIFKKEMEIENIDGNIANEKAEQEQLKRDFTDVKLKCSKCNQPISPKLVISEKERIKKAIKTSKLKVDKYTEDLIPLCKKLGKLKVFSEKNKTLIDEINKLKNKIELAASKEARNNILLSSKKALLKQIKETKVRIEKIKKETLTIDLPLHQERIRLKNVELIPLKRLARHYQRELEITNWLIKDPLSNSGIKAFIFNQMLELINEQLTLYSPLLGFTIKFGIDLESANKDFYITLEKGTSIRMYQDLSGGEQQLTNICIAFAIHDVLAIERDINILILDELFESLDSSNIELVSNLVTQKAQGKSIHLITHQRDFNPINAKTIALTKVNGRTKIAE